MHICYGYGIKANIDWKQTLGSEWRQYEQTFPLLARSRIDQVSLECANSHVPIELIGAPRRQGRARRRHRRRDRPGRDAGRGGRDARAALAMVPADRLYPCTNCGMVPLARECRAGQARGARRGRRAGPARSWAGADGRRADSGPRRRCKLPTPLHGNRGLVKRLLSLLYTPRRRLPFQAPKHSVPGRRFVPPPSREYPRP